MKKKQIRNESTLQNPCYNKETGEDCKLRTATCHATCNRWKIYTTLKDVEKRQRRKKALPDYMYQEYVKDRKERLKKLKR